MTKKIALITGVTGQDGAYLSRFFAKERIRGSWYQATGLSFSTPARDWSVSPHVEKRNFVLHYGDLTDSTNLIRIVQQVQPNEIYNLAAQSHVVSLRDAGIHCECRCYWDPAAAGSNTDLGLEKKTRFYQASTSEMFQKFKRYLRKKPHHFIRAALTGRQRYTRIGFA